MGYDKQVLAQQPELVWLAHVSALLTHRSGIDLGIVKLQRLLLLRACQLRIVYAKKDEAAANQPLQMYSNGGGGTVLKAQSSKLAISQVLHVMATRNIWYTQHYAGPKPEELAAGMQIYFTRACNDLLRRLTKLEAKHDTQITAAHIPGKENTVADAISRNNVTKARKVHETLKQDQKPIPQTILQYEQDMHQAFITR